MRRSISVGRLLLALLLLAALTVIYWSHRLLSNESIVVSKQERHNEGDAILYSLTQETNMETIRDTNVNKSKLCTERLAKSAIDSKYAENIKLWLSKIIAINRQFQPVTSETCNNTCPLEDYVCKTKSLDGWNDMLLNAGLRAVPLFSGSEYIFPWEKDYLSNPPLHDIKTLPDLSFSRVYVLINGRLNYMKIVECEKNQKLVFRIDLVDGYGRLRHYGGDEVRTWISNKDETRSASGFVTDLGNGTYLATVTPVWPGYIKLNVAVVYPREYLRAALYHMGEGRHRFIYGLFRRNNVKEVTLCHTTPNIPGRPCVCDYTDVNRRPFYCGRPLDPREEREEENVAVIIIDQYVSQRLACARLQCSDWVSVKPTSRPIANDYTSAERDMASQMSRPPDKSTIRHDLTIHVNDRGEKQPPLIPCLQLNRSVTWNQKSPRGMWKSGSWSSFVCKELPLTSSWVQRCLRSTHVWLIGDSNLHNTAEVLYDMAKIYMKKVDGRWPKRRTGYNTKNDITVTFRGHEHPLFKYLTSPWIPKLDQGGIEDYLGEIPSTGSHVVLMHYYLHLCISHLSAIFVRFLAIRNAVSDLLERNPSVLVGIRGPHISAVEWERNHLFGGDVQASFIMSILYQIFKPLQDKVVFLDAWDMTISLKNERMHPGDEVSKALLRTLLSFKCQR